MDKIQKSVSLDIAKNPSRAVDVLAALNQSSFREELCRAVARTLVNSKIDLSGCASMYDAVFKLAEQRNVSVSDLLRESIAESFYDEKTEAE